MGTVHIDWGDGTSGDVTVADPPNDWSISNRIHRYWQPGNYQIDVTGTSGKHDPTPPAPVAVGDIAPVLVGTPQVQFHLTATGVTFTKPVGLQPGDVLLVAMRGQVQGSSDYSCTAFTRVGPPFVPSDPQRVVGWYLHPVIDPALEPASYAFSRISGGRNIGAMLVVRGHGGKVPSFAVGYSGDGLTTGVPQSRHTAAFTFVGKALQLWQCGGEHTASNSHVPVSIPAGFTEVVAATTDTNLTVSRTSLWVGKIDGRSSPAAEGTLTVAGQSLAAESITFGAAVDWRFPTVDAMLAKPGFTWAHRGNSLYFAEESAYAYRQAVARGYACLELSINRTSDGVWVAIHDRDPNRTSGVTGQPNVAQLTWAQIQALPQNVISTDGNDMPYMRLEEFLNEFAAQGYIIILDPKYAWIDSLAFRTEFWAICSSIGTTKCIPKYFIDTTSFAQQAADRGFKAWGYAYEATLADGNFATWANAPWVMLGMEYQASQASWDTIKAFGKPVVGHIARNQADYAAAITKGAAGVQCGGSETILAVNALT